MKKAKRKNYQDSGPLSEAKKEEQFWPFPNSSIEKRVAVMLLDGMGPRQIAEELKVSYSEFLKWYMNRGAQNYLMISRNDEAEKRKRNAEENTQ